MKNWLKQLMAVLTLVLLALPGVSFSVGDLPEVLPGSKAASMSSCVAPTADIRRNHMKYLKHKRDLTVHQGIRNEEFSLRECVNCHAAKDDSNHYVAVNDEGQFCQTCHARVVEKLDCFECHRTTPEN